MTRRCIALAALALVGFPGPAAAEDTTAELDPLLDRLARVAELYLDEALHFTCDESIQFSSRSTSSLHRFRYVYRYSAEKNGLIDHREPKQAPAGSSLAPGAAEALEGLGLPEVLLRPYSWIFIFRPGLSERYQFEIEGHDRLFDRPAVRIGFHPLAPFEPGINEWVGTAWVDRGSAQLLRVEAYRAADATRRVHYTTDFDLARNGMRFPGQVRIKGVRPEFAVVQTYKRYEFYGVRTSEDISARTAAAVR